LCRRHVADVVHERVERAELVEHLRRHPLDVVPGCDVALDEERLAAALTHAGGGGLSAGPGAAVMDDDPRAFLGGAQRERGAEARAGPRHHHRLALEAALPHRPRVWPMRATGGEALARTLAASGVRDVFGVPAGKLGPFLAAIPETLRWTGTRHEAAAA